MVTNDADGREHKESHATLIRLANSCERAAARGKATPGLVEDLNEEDYRTIADILRKMADVIE